MVRFFVDRLELFPKGMEKGDLSVKFIVKECIGRNETTGCIYKTKGNLLY